MDIRRKNTIKIRAFHRKLALRLGILGILCCVVLGILAWVMGNNDLKDMAAGRMDPAGRDLTQAGKICGIISVILQAIALVGVIIWLILVLLAGGTAVMQEIQT